MISCLEFMRQFRQKFSSVRLYNLHLKQTKCLQLDKVNQDSFILLVTNNNRRLELQSETLIGRASPLISSYSKLLISFQIQRLLYSVAQQILFIRITIHSLLCFNQCTFQEIRILLLTLELKPTIMD